MTLLILSIPLLMACAGLITLAMLKELHAADDAPLTCTGLDILGGRH